MIALQFIFLPQPFRINWKSPSSSTPSSSPSFQFDMGDVIIDDKSTVSRNANSLVWLTCCCCWFCVVVLGGRFSFCHACIYFCHNWNLLLAGRRIGTLVCVFFHGVVVGRPCVYTGLVITVKTCNCWFKLKYCYSEGL